MSLAEMSQPSAQHITLRASSILHRTVSQHWGTQCCVPSLLSLGYRPARTLLARLWGRLLHKGKCSAEHLSSSDATPCRCCLGVFRSFLLLPYCPTLSRVGTGGSHPPLFPSVGFASLPGSSMERHPAGHKPWSRMQAGPRQRQFLSAVVYPTQRLFCPFPNAGRSQCLAPWWQVPACHLHLTLCSPLSHGQGTPPAPSTARVGVSVPRHPPWHLPGSPFSTRFEPQLQRSRQEPKASSALFSTRNREQIC